jgi:hypothetical protein
VPGWEATPTLTTAIAIGQPLREIQFADDYDGDEAGGRFFQMMKKLDAEKTA